MCSHSGASLEKIYFAGMSSSAVSLGNGAWGAKNISLSNLSKQQIEGLADSFHNEYIYQLSSTSSEIPLSGYEYGDASIFLDGIAGSSSGLQAIAGETENYAISWGSYLKIDETMSNRSFIDQHENALITVYKVNSNGSYTNLSGVPQIEPEGIDVEEGKFYF